jgi:hypothetical protein
LARVLILGGNDEFCGFGQSGFQRLNPMSAAKARTAGVISASIEEHNWLAIVDDMIVPVVAENAARPDQFFPAGLPDSITGSVGERPTSRDAWLGMSQL